MDGSSPVFELDLSVQKVHVSSSDGISPRIEVLPFPSKEPARRREGEDRRQMQPQEPLSKGLTWNTPCPLFHFLCH